MITSVDQLDPDGNYTLADYLSWQFAESVEIIKGKLFKMSPAPRPKHQLIAGSVHAQFYNLVRRRKCKAFMAPFDVYFPTENGKPSIVQPDVSIVCDLAKVTKRACEGAPDVTVEVLSPSTSKKDLTTKFELYSQFGVKEYWIVFPEEELVQQFVHNGQELKLHGIYTTGLAPSEAIEGLTLDIDEVFDRELPLEEEPVLTRI